MKTTHKATNSKAPKQTRQKRDRRNSGNGAREVIAARNRPAGSEPLSGMARIHQQALWIQRERAAEPQSRNPDPHRVVRGPKRAKTPHNRALLLKGIMTHNPEVIGPDETVQEAAERMDAMNIGFLPVCENDRIVGVLTDRDIAVRAFSAASDPRDARVRAIMTPEVMYTFEEQDVLEAARIMEEAQVRRLIVLNSERRLVGIVSLDDLAAAPRDEKLAGVVLKRVSTPIA